MTVKFVSVLRYLSLTGLLVAEILLCGTSTLLAEDFYVAPDGRTEGSGTRESPWDIASALSGKQTLPPGSTLWLQPGIYRHPERGPHGAYVVGSLHGTAEAPIQVRGVANARTTIDGGLSVGSNEFVEQAPRHVWFRDFEITVSEKGRSTNQQGSAPLDLKAPFGGLNVYGSQDCRFINLVIHNNVGNGIGAWSTATGTEFYGCIVYDNGWSAPDRGHGHGFYGQNQEGWKVVSNCIFSVPAGRGGSLGQFYGSDNSHLDNFRLEQNIAYTTPPQRNAFLLGGGAVAHNNHALNNYFYNSSLQLGYNRPGCVGGRAAGNIIFRGSLNLRFYEECVVADNLVVDGAVSVAACGELEVRDNQVFRDQMPEGFKAILLPNRYDNSRAHLAVFNWNKSKTVTLKTAPMLKSGDAFRLLKPGGYFGQPIWEGRCQDDAIQIPMQDEFAAFVLLKGPP